MMRHFYSKNASKALKLALPEGGKAIVNFSLLALDAGGSWSGLYETADAQVADAIADAIAAKQAPGIRELNAGELDEIKKNSPSPTWNFGASSSSAPTSTGNVEDAGEGKASGGEPLPDSALDAIQVAELGAVELDDELDAFLSGNEVTATVEPAAEAESVEAKPKEPARKRAARKGKQED